MKNKMVGLDLSSVIGMGISGPVLSFLTASLFAAFKGVFGWGSGAYAVIMFFLSAVLAVFPAVKSEYSKMLKIAMWPIATVMIFATAWGSSTGMSAGEEVLSGFSNPMMSMAEAPMPPPPPDDVPMSPETTETIRRRHLAIITNVTPEIPEVMLSQEEDSVVQGSFFKRLK